MTQCAPTEKSQAQMAKHRKPQAATQELERDRNRMHSIAVRGARTHNLKSVDIDLPHNQLTVITGVSGSGKSSLAFDTVYAEGQRQYIESLSVYARQFLEGVISRLGDGGGGEAVAVDPACRRRVRGGRRMPGAGVMPRARNIR